MTMISSESRQAVKGAVEQLSADRWWSATPELRAIREAKLAREEGRKAAEAAAAELVEELLGRVGNLRVGGRAEGGRDGVLRFKAPVVDVQVLQRQYF